MRRLVSCAVQRFRLEALVFLPKCLVQNPVGSGSQRARLTMIADAHHDACSAVDVTFVAPLSERYFSHALGDVSALAEMTNGRFTLHSHRLAHWSSPRATQCANRSCRRV